jgi:hypothetical protein
MPRSLLAPLGALALAGCPFIFEAPDLSKVDAGGTTTAPETDADTDADADADTDADTDTDPTVPPPDAPEVVQFDLVPELDRLEAKLAIAPGDGALLGGDVSISDGVTTWTFDIPDGFAVWEPKGTSTAVLDAWSLLPCDGVDATYTLVVTDQDGVQSPAAVAPLLIEGLGLLPEILGPNQVNPSAASWTACVEFSNAVPLFDLEDIGFNADFAGLHTFTLAWAGLHDMDLGLRDGTGTTVASSAFVTTAWESFVYDLTAGSNYTLNCRIFDAEAGVPAPYEAHVFVRPQ